MDKKLDFQDGTNYDVTEVSNDVTGVNYDVTAVNYDVTGVNKTLIRSIRDTQVLYV